jgi:proteasome accessory factor B
VRLSGWAAREATERRLHASQKMHKIPGGIELELEVSGFEEVTQWVLSYGAHAVVLEPPDLAKRVRSELEGAARRYATDPVRKFGKQML